MCVESCLCSLLSITCISIDRYVRICKNQVFQKMFYQFPPTLSKLRKLQNSLLTLNRETAEELSRMRSTRLGSNFINMTLNLLQSINAFYFQRYFDIFTKRNAILMCVGVWIICFILQIPNFFDLMGYTYVFSNILLNRCSISFALYSTHILCRVKR